MLKQLGKFGIIGLLIATGLVYLKFLATHSYYPTDYVAFLAASRVLMVSPHQLYDYSAQLISQLQLVPDDPAISPTPLIPFANPPTFLIFFLPFSKLPPALAYKIMIILNLGVLVIILRKLTELFPVKSTFQRLLVLALACSFAPVYNTIVQVQSSLVTLLIIIYVYASLRSQKWWLAGLVSSTLFYKPQLGIVLWLYLLLSVNRQVIWGLLVGGLGWLAISWLMAGNWVSSWISAIRLFSTYDNTSLPSLVSWVGLWHQLLKVWPGLPADTIAYIFSLLTLLTSGLMLSKISIKSKLLPQAFSIIIMTTLLSVIHVHYQEVVMLIFILFSNHTQLHLRKVQILVALGWLIYLLAIFSPWYPASLPILPTIYLVVLWIVIMIKGVRPISNA